MRRFLLLVFLFTLCVRTVAAGSGDALPAAYFPLLEAGVAKVERHLNALPNADLKTLENPISEWRHFPYAILAPAVLYAKRHPQNARYHDPKMLALALRIGDLLASEHERGVFEPRGDSDWDTALWLEAYRLLERELGAERRARWAKAIKENIALLVADAKDRIDFPWYHSPYIGTSPNHYAQWAGLLLLGGITFNDKEWEQLGKQILRRFAVTDQSPDGFWGEHNRAGPTVGYNHLTLTAVALYYEYSKDPAALTALRRALDFHKHYTFLDGTPVDVINDRNRRWGVSAWGQFAFSHFSDGRGYASFLTSQFNPETISADVLGRLAQDALYFHEGTQTPAPQQLPRYAHQMTIPAGVRKSGAWQVAYSGIMNSQAINSQFYLDRQGHLSIFHQRLGLIITGANSKRQPELSTFSEKLEGQTVHMPISTRLQMSDAQDRLSLAYNTFFSDLYVPTPSEQAVSLRFVITGRGRPAQEPLLTLQLILKAGETLTTGAGKQIKLSSERIELQDLGGWISHRGWKLKVDPMTKLVWPVYPFNPYSNAPETNVQYAVGALSVPLRLKSQPGRYIRTNEQEIAFVLEVQ
ncbi:MAG TPA: hypothetical protein VFZ34_24880 [Blastocatellia bacterium]|nr:hypothetical protein [Blastocatellia bacterium]